MSCILYQPADEATASELKRQGCVPLLQSGYWASPDTIRTERRFINALHHVQRANPLSFEDAYLRNRHAEILDGRKSTADRHEVEVQADTVLRVLADPRVITIVTGPPGTTKSTVAALACQSIRKVFPDTPIMVMTQEIPALQRLQTKIHLDHILAFDVAQALSDACDWPRDACVVVDEAGLLGTDTMMAVLEKAAQAGVRKLILIGDDKQLAPPAGGQPFRWLGVQKTVNRVELAHSFRQRNPALRSAVRHLYHGLIGEALALVPHYVYPEEALIPVLRQSLTAFSADNTYVVIKGSDVLRINVQHAIPEFKVFTLNEAQGLAIDRVVFIIAEPINRAELLVGCSRQRYDLVMLVDAACYHDDADFIARVADYPQSLMVVDVLTIDQLNDELLLNKVDQA